MTKLSSHQPNLLPWAGFWHRVLRSDMHVVSSGVDFCPRDYQHRVKLHGSFITLPVSTKKGPIKAVEHGSLEPLIQRIERELMVRRYPFHSRLVPMLGILSRHKDGGSLTDLCLQAYLEIGRLLGYQGSFVVSDQVEGESKSVRLRNRLESLVPDFDYLAGKGTASYLDQSFGHDVWVQHPVGPVADETVLQLIASDPDPRERILSQFEFVAHESVGTAASVLAVDRVLE